MLVAVHACSLSVLLSAVEMSIKTQTAQEIAEGASAGINNTRVCRRIYLLQLLFEGCVYFIWSSRLCGYCLMAVFNQRNVLYVLQAVEKERLVESCRKKLYLHLILN